MPRIHQPQTTHIPHPPTRVQPEPLPLKRIRRQIHHPTHTRTCSGTAAIASASLGVSTLTRAQGVEDDRPVHPTTPGKHPPHALHQRLHLTTT
ncbi:hypothetical protein ACWD4V_33870, partial [Streptomyces tsukubensis]